VAHYTIQSGGEGDAAPQRDAYYFRVRVSRDDDYLGSWVGFVSGLDRAIRLPPTMSEDEKMAFYRAAPVALALHIKRQAEAGAMPAAWQLDVHDVLLDFDEILAIARRNPRTTEWDNPGEVVAEFDV
jgi:hypothetical protein